MIIDAHAHVSDTDYGNVDVLLNQFNAARVDKGILVPGGMLDVNKMTKYITGEEQPVTLDVPNRLVEDAIKKYPDKFYGFYCVNPHLGLHAVRGLETAVKDRGFKGLKLAPMVHQFSMTSQTVLDLAELCGKLKIPFYTHVVYSPAASTKKLAYLAEQFPNTNFILGHMGFGPSDIDAIEYAKKNNNIYFETSQGSYLIIRKAIDTIGAERVIFGSEFPMYHVKVSLENIYVQGLNDHQLDAILYKNILALLNGEAP